MQVFVARCCGKGKLAPPDGGLGGPAPQVVITTVAPAPPPALVPALPPLPVVPLLPAVPGVPPPDEPAAPPVPPPTEPGPQPEASVSVTTAAIPSDETKGRTG